MSSLPTVSVCIANYNGLSIIDDCIASVLAQDCGFQVEIIVHDDASTDGVAQHIRKHYPNVRLLESIENVGFCIANNRMEKIAKSEYLLLLNNDAALFPDALRTLHQAATTIGKPAILGLPQYDAATGKLIDIGSTFDPFLNTIPNLDKGRSEVGMVIGACLWLPKSLWQELGGFPDWFGSLAEDMYLCCLARLRGYPVQALNTSGFRHWVGKSLGGGKIIDDRLATTLRRRTTSERNKSYVMVLCYPAPLSHLLLPLHFFLLLAEGVLLSLIKRDLSLFGLIYWKTIQSVWSERKRLLNRRKEIQDGRKISARKFFSPFGIMPHKLRLLLRHGVPEIR